MTNYKEISETEQLKIVQYVKDVFTDLEKLNKHRKEECLNIYKSVRSFKSDKANAWSSSFKINKCHEIETKIASKLFSKDPRWIVSTRTDHFEPGDKFKQWEEREEMKVQQNEMAHAIQEYLTTTIDKYKLKKQFRLWGKSMLRYGNGYAQVVYKYDKSSKKDADNNINDYVIWEYPTIDIPRWTDIYVDPRYMTLEEMPWIIKVTENVRLDILKRKKDEYINIDKIDKLPNRGDYSDSDTEGYKRAISELTGIPTEKVNEVDKNTLTIKTYFWKYKKEWHDYEKDYEISIVNDMFLIQCKEIISKPFVGIRCFEDTESYNSIGVIEPIISLQDELNFKKNSASDYINQALNRSFIWSPNSWINPAHLTSKPWGVIATKKTVAEAMNNLQEIPLRTLDSSYFQEQNDLERQIQSLTHTVDTSNPKSQQALTNTATWIKVKYAESNAVINEIRTHFEEWMVELAYKLLECVYNNMNDENIIIDKVWGGFLQINKEAFKDAIERYKIKIEVNSSSFDNIENRREDAIALMNVLLQMKNAWVNVDLKEWAKKVLHTFELINPDDLIMEDDMNSMQPEQWMQPWGTIKPVTNEKKEQSPYNLNI